MYSPFLQEWMLHPHSTARNLWDALIASLLIYIAIFTPVALGFTYEQSADHQGFEAFVDVAFIVDILINFRTG